MYVKENNMRYSALNLVRGALCGHRQWQPAWRDKVPRTHYDIVVIGGGGHGLATAYYLAKHHGVTNVAVLERGWIGGGNTGRNTNVVRSNYFFPESAAFSDQIGRASCREKVGQYVYIPVVAR